MAKKKATKKSTAKKGTRRKTTAKRGSASKKGPRAAPAAFSSSFAPSTDHAVRPVHELRTSIETVTQEIARVRDRAKQEADSLEKIRSVLDVGPLNELMSVLGQLETRIGQLEQDTMAAAAGAESARSELANEQERLRKLWDAYVAQEDEMRRTKDDFARSQERLAERDRILADLQKELAAFRGMPDMRTRVAELERENANLHKDLGGLTQQVRKQETELSRAHTDLAAYEKAKVDKRGMDGLRKDLDAERERLAKLYKVYEETEAKMKAAMSELEEWRGWFQDNREYFQAVGKAAEIKART